MHFSEKREKIYSISNGIMLAWNGVYFKEEMHVEKPKCKQDPENFILPHIWGANLQTLYWGFF